MERFYIQILKQKFNTSGNDHHYCKHPFAPKRFIFLVEITPSACENLIFQPGQETIVGVFLKVIPKTELFINYGLRYFPKHWGYSILWGRARVLRVLAM
jgi:hypothetical protein